MNGEILSSDADAREGMFLYSQVPSLMSDGNHQTRKLTLE